MKNNCRYSCESKIRTKKLKDLKVNASELHKQHLLRRASAMHIANKTTSAKSTINLIKIERTIDMLKQIIFLTNTKQINNINTINIPEDKRVGWNKIKQRKKLSSKTIDDPKTIEKIINEQNAHHLNQAQGTSLTIESLISLIGKDSFTSISQEIFNGNANLDHLNFSPLINKYLNNLKYNEIVN